MTPYLQNHGKFESGVVCLNQGGSVVILSLFWCVICWIGHCFNAVFSVYLLEMFQRFVLWNDEIWAWNCDWKTRCFWAKITKCFLLLGCLCYGNLAIICCDNYCVMCGFFRINIPCVKTIKCTCGLFYIVLRNHPMYSGNKYVIHSQEYGLSIAHVQFYVTCMYSICITLLWTTLDACCAVGIHQCLWPLVFFWAKTSVTAPPVHINIFFYKSREW